MNDETCEKCNATPDQDWLNDSEMIFGEVGYCRECWNAALKKMEKQDAVNARWGF